MLRFAAPLSVSLLLLTACGGPGTTGTLSSGPDGDPAPAQTGCGGDHELIGATAVLNGRFHDVGGTVTLIDDCTLVVEGFTFDGGGLDVRVVGSPDGSYGSGHVLTEDLRRPEGYQNDTLEIPLPEGTTPDDVKFLSVWCVPAGADFGSGELK